jgi:hypothetical protein
VVIKIDGPLALTFGDPERSKVKGTTLPSKYFEIGGRYEFGPYLGNMNDSLDILPTVSLCR